MSKKRNWKLMLLSGAALTCASPAFAQDDDAADETLETSRNVIDTDDVIIVTAPNYVPIGSETANKADIPLIETPQSVSVVTRDQIDLLNFIDAQQAVRYVAGVSGENYGPDLRFDFITVRGFVPKQFVDGLATPVSTTIFSTGLDLYAFESLDILKGPASVLYGSAPPGGIFNQVSRRAEAEFGGELSLKYGNDDFKQIASTVTGPLTDGVSGRITFLYRDRDAERDFVTARRVLVAPTFAFELGPDTIVEVLGYYQDDKNQGDTNGFLPVSGTLLPNPLGEVPRSRNLGEPDFNEYNRDQYGIGFELSHAFSDALQFDANFKYSDYSEARDVIFGNGLLADNRTVTRGNSPYAEDVKSIAVDSRLSGDFEAGATSHLFLLGVDYRNVDNNSGFGFVGASSIDLFDPVYGVGGDVSPGVTTRFNEQEINQTGIYAQDQIKFGNFILLLSGRYDWYDSDQIAPFTAFGSVQPSTERSAEDFTYRVGANYVFDSGITPYVSYATSFEPVLGSDMSGTPFEPTTGKQIEGGVKYDGRNLADGFDIFAAAAVYRIVQQNVVATGSSPNLVVFGEQLGEVEIIGGELEFVARIDDRLSFNGSYSYTDSEITASNTAAEVGLPLEVTPKHKVSGLVDYTFQEGALRGFGFNVGARYTSSSAGSRPSLFNPVVFDSDDSFLVDASLRYDTRRWRLSVNGSNITDKRYVARCASVSNCNFGAGLQVIGTVTLKLF